MLAVTIVLRRVRQLAWPVLLGLLLLAGTARAQPEFSAWRFGNRAGVQFPVPAGGPPVGVSGSLIRAAS